MKKSFDARILLCTLAVAALSGCGGGSTSSDSGSGSGGLGGSSSSGGGSCNYTDLVSASERTQANACGIQVSANYAAAQSSLESAIALCQRGNKTDADTTYEQYKKIVKVAQGTSEALSCGGSNGPVLPEAPSAQTYYNMCIKTTGIGGTLKYSGSCFGPVKKGESDCGNDGTSYVSQHASQSACTTAGTAYLNSKSE
jgi:hypothetical protein